MIFWWTALNEMFEASDSLPAAFASASRCPKSNRSHCKAAVETVPVASVPRLPVRPVSGSVWLDEVY